MFKIKQGLAPTYLSENFTTCESVHSYETRASKDAFYVPKVNSSGQTTFMYTGIKAWNGLPTDIRGIDKMKQFKITVKKHLFENVNNDEM